MPNQLLANEVLAPLPEVALSEPDYRAFCAALEASARGRVFLAEYAKRNRHANTEELLGALERLQSMVREQAATSEADRIRQELRALLAALQAAKPAIDASASAIKAAKLGAMLAFVQHRIESIVASTTSPLPAEVAALVMPDGTPQETPQERSHLFVVPTSDQPELPIPAPEAAAPAIALVQEAPAAPPARPTAMTIPEVNLFDAAPQAPASTQTPLIPAQAGIQENGLAPDDADTLDAIIETMIALPPAEIENAIEHVVAIEIEQPAEIAAPAEAPPAPPQFRLIPAEVGIVGGKLDLEDFRTEATPAPAPVDAKPLARGRAERLPAEDPLALIVALSEAERIALFT